MDWSRLISAVRRRRSHSSSMLAVMTWLATSGRTGRSMAFISTRRTSAACSSAGSVAVAQS